MNIDQKPEAPATECACRKALEYIVALADGFPATESCDGIDAARTALATPCECAGLREELLGELDGYKDTVQAYIEHNTHLRAELAAANERAERARKESTDKAECIRELVKGIDGAEYWAPLDAVAYIAKGFLRLRDERDTAQAGWKEAVEALRRVRQGYMNILEFRQLDSERWGQRDGYGGRYGALTEDEIREAIAPIDPIVARFDAQGGGK